MQLFNNMRVNQNFSLKKEDEEISIPYLFKFDIHKQVIY